MENYWKKEKKELTEEEKKKIAQDLIEGYKKMASLNQQLAEDGFIEGDNSQQEKKKRRE